MGNTTEATLTAGDGIRHYIDFTLEYSLTPDEIAEFISDLPQQKKMEIIMAILENPQGVIDVLREMSEDDRLQVFGEFCKHCGCDDPRCNCMRDD